MTLAATTGKRAARFAAAAGLCLAAAAAGAADFYVSSVHANRSDGHSGADPAAPWSSFEKVKAEWHVAIRPGDTVHLERGSRWEWSYCPGRFWRISRGGDATNGPMTIRGDDYGAGPKPELVHTGTGVWGTIKIADHASYVTLRDFVIDGGSASGGGGNGILVGGLNHDGPIESLRFLNLTLRNLASSDAHYICGIWLAASSNNVIRDVLIEGNDISGYNAFGINVYGDKSTNRHAAVHSNIVVRNNRIHSPCTNFYGNVGGGIHIAFAGASNVYEYNYLSGEAPVGAFMLMNCGSDETNLVIRHNIVAGNPRGPGLCFCADGAGAPGRADGDVTGNLIFGCSGPGVWVWSRGLYTGRFRLYNNTLHSNNAAGVSQWNAGAELLVHSGSTGVELELTNNIFSAQNRDTLCVQVHSGYTGAVARGYNLYWRAQGGTLVNDRGALFDASNLAVYENSARSGDPLFVDPRQAPLAISSTGGADPDGYDLTAHSPAVDAGADLGGAYADSIDRVPRPQMANWDIGAYERRDSGGTPAGFMILLK